MAFDSLMMFGVIDELNRNILNGKIEKIYQPEKEELVFHIHTHNGNLKLHISADSSNPHINLMGKSLPNPSAPPNFCMLLRKHLQGARIKEISQKDFERVAVFSFENTGELGYSVTHRLIVEIMGKHSNITLVDTETGKIMDSIKRISFDMSRVRQLFPGKIYEFPPSQEKYPFHDLSEEYLKELCTPYDNAPDKLPKLLLQHIQGISPGIAEHLCWNSENSPHIAEHIFNKHQELLNSLNSSGFSPRIYMDEQDKFMDFHLLPLSFLEENCQIIKFDNISACLEYFYENKHTYNRIKQKSSDLLKSVKSQIDKAYLKKQRLLQDILDAENADKYRLYGELLTANLHMCKTGDPKVEVISYYDGSSVTIPLDSKLSPAKNAQLYYKKYGKLKTSVKEKHVQLAETEEDINYLESVHTFIENAGSTEDVDAIRLELQESGYIRVTKSKEKAAKLKFKPIEYTTSEDFKVIVGRNNKENDHISFKVANSKDLWLHTKDIPGSHTLLISDGRDFTESAIFEAAAVAAYHSKARNSQNVPVDYVPIKLLKKPAGAKAGMVIFTGNRTIYVNPTVPK